MKDFLQDLVSHTHALGFLPLIKINSNEENTEINSMSIDKSVVLNAKTHNPVDGFDGVFGMPNLNKLDLHLRCPEYKEGAQISVLTQNSNGTVVPSGLHFQNRTGDFENDYRFMNATMLEEKLKTVKFNGAKWDVEFVPSVAAIQRFKFQAAAHTEETVFKVITDGNDLVFSFGDASTHAGSFTFHSPIEGKLKKQWAWPVSYVQSILSLSGDISMHISDIGALKITIDSGIAVYDYILPAYTK